MKKKLSILFFIFLGSCLFSAKAVESNGIDVKRYLQKQGWESYESKKSVNVPNNDVAVAMYYGKDSSAPSCGLLVRGKSDLEFIEILSPEQGEQYPQCVGVNDVAEFSIAERKYLVFEYSDRDTRDDLYEKFFFVYKDGTNEYKIDDYLNSVASGNYVISKDSTLRNSLKSQPKALDSVKYAKANFFKKMEPQLEFLSRDFIGDKESSFAIFKNKATNDCVFLVEGGAQLKKFSSDIFSGVGDCTKFVASGKLEKNGHTYYLGMFTGSAESKGLAIFSFSNAGGESKAEVEMARKIISLGDNSDIKSIKKYISSN